MTIQKERPVNGKGLFKKLILLVATNEITDKHKDDLFKKHMQLIRIMDNYGYPGTKVYLLSYKIEIENIMNELESLGLLKNPLIT